MGLAGLVAKVERQRRGSQQGVVVVLEPTRALTLGSVQRSADDGTAENSRARVRVPLLPVQERIRGVSAATGRKQRSVGSDATATHAEDATVDNSSDRGRLDREQRAAVVALGQQGRVEWGPAVVRHRRVIHGVQELVLVLWRDLKLVRDEAVRPVGFVETDLRCLRLEEKKWNIMN